MLLRALCKYLLQTRMPFSQTYVIDSLVANASIARLLVELFERRFDPSHGAPSHDGPSHGGPSHGAPSQEASSDTPPGRTASEATDARASACDAVVARIDTALDEVASLDQDRILRAFRDLILATLRTNAWRRDANGEPRSWLAFKLDSARVPDLPLPRPMVEIFVYSADVEGVHLRGGPVARGGLRWSDRREDFRTEVLGLMKAQMVKNAVIVPVGSKGGFYVKRALPEEREAAQAVVIECYRTFLRGLLDLTDNLVGGEVAPPESVVRHDGDDPYLVVAADKGTATFSDHANAVAIDYGFWLGDAFASGGVGRLRSQEDGHHRARCLGVGQAPLQEPGPRHAERAVHRGRHRRHGRRRVRQRHAALAAHPPRRGVQPSPRVHRSRAGCRGRLRRTLAAVRAAALELVGLRRVADLGRRRHLRAHRQADPPVRRGLPCARHRRHGRHPPLSRRPR